jgi:UDP-N-acetylmuramoyl-tripeptide--D-alanyl-D-alanine ligase
MTSTDLYKLIKNTGAKVKTDSRAVVEGDIFFSLKGDNFDGNSFAGDALKKGAIKAVIDDIEYAVSGTILVDNVLETLQSIATIHRKSLNIPLLAITGTNGKTTTKELISLVLKSKYNVYSTLGNLNNHIGVPLTLLDAGPDVSFMVVEMGANHQGEIASLCNIALPDAGLITNIGKAHLEGFGSFEGVIKAKSELYTYLSENKGTAIYNDSNPILSEVLRSLDIISVPYSEPANELKVDKIVGHPKLIIDISYDGLKYKVESELAGILNAENILAAIAVGLVYGVEMERIIESVCSYKPDNNRSQIVKTTTNLLLCDSYNANPDSMSLALTSFLESAQTPKTIIVGDMFELGDYEEIEHKKIIELLSAKDNISVYLVGSIFSKMGSGSRFRLFQSTESLIDHLKRKPIKNSFVFIKGSRGIGLERAYEYL